jgi:tRNA 2-thiouridine synthesizing protein A
MDILLGHNSGIVTKMKADPAQDTTPDAAVPDATLDITGDICPMTFVRARLALDRLQSGEILLILLRGEEPRRNVPRSAVALGHTVLAEHEIDGVTRLLLRLR